MYGLVKNWEEAESISMDEAMNRLEAFEYVRAEKCIYDMMNHSGSEQYFEECKRKLEEVYPSLPAIGYDDKLPDKL